MGILRNGIRARAHQGNWQPQRNRNFRQLLSSRVEYMLLNGAAQIEEIATKFRQFALLHSITYVQLRMITVLGNCGCVAVASFPGVPSPLDSKAEGASLPPVRNLSVSSADHFIHPQTEHVAYHVLSTDNDLSPFLCVWNLVCHCNLEIYHYFYPWAGGAMSHRPLIGSPRLKIYERQNC
jgi:hypothetical protein